MNEYDPNRAEVGIWNRSHWNGAVKRTEDLVDPAQSYQYDEENYKYAEEVEIPPDPAVPLFPEPIPGGVDPNETGRVVDTDLDQRGAPTKADGVRKKIRMLRTQVINKEKAALHERVESQNARFQRNQEADSRVEFDRHEMETNSPTVKTAAGPFSELTNPELNPIRLMLILDTQWGPEWKEWEAEVIATTADVDIARVNMDKLMAVKVLINNDNFWTDPNVFSKVCLAFAGKMVDWGHIQEPRLHEITACVSLVERYIKEQDFSDDVAAYVAAAGIRDGYIMLPPVLSFAGGPFSLELAMNIGDGVIQKQQDLMQALDTENAEILKSDEAIQYMRLLRCQYHTQDMIDQVRA